MGETGEALRALGGMQVHDEHSLMQIYRQDQARLPAAFKKMIDAPLAVAQPQRASSVVEVLRWCREHGVAAVPRGAGSNAFGGSLPLGPSVVIDTRRLDKVRDVDDESAWVGAGATWNRIMAHLGQYDKALRVSTTSQFSTLGGMIATGGMGLGCTGYGSIEDNVLEVELALPDGVHKLSVEDAAHMFRTDGQLGIVTGARIKIRDIPKWTQTVVMQAASYQDAIDGARELADMDGIHTVLVYDAHRVAELNQLLGRDFVPEKDTVIARFEAATPMQVPESDVPPEVVGFLWQQRHFPMRPLKMGPGLLGAEVVLDDAHVGPFTQWGSKALAAFDLHAANEAYVLPGGKVLNITTFLTDAQGKAYTLHVAQVARLTKKALKFGGTPYGGGLWNLPVAKHRHGDLKSLIKLKKDIDPTQTVNPGKSLSPKAKGHMSGKLLRGAAAKHGPGMSGMIAGMAKYKPRQIRSVVQDVAHPGTNTSQQMHPRVEHERGLPADEYSHQACTQCAACIVVCPAFMHTGDERTTARGKLQFMAQYASDPASIDADEASHLYQCIRCRACEDVCQTDLPLLAAFESMEQKLTTAFGFPAKKVTTFLEGFEADKDAQDLIDETRGTFQETHVAYAGGAQ